MRSVSLFVVLSSTLPEIGPDTAYVVCISVSLGFRQKTKWYGTTFGIPNFPTPSRGFPQWKAMDLSQEEKNEVSTIMFDENLDWDNWDGKW